MAAQPLSSTLPPADQVAARIHSDEVRANKNAGVFSKKLPSGEESMAPYEELSDAAKSDILAGVVRVYTAIDAVAADESQPKTRKAG